MAECLSMGDQDICNNYYQQLVGLQDIKGLVDLNHEAIRDILRSKTGNQELSLKEVGALEDMSGTNDAFNSSICSMQVTANVSKKKEDSTEDESAQKPFYFVIKSPPKCSFIKLMHKMTKPFLNEVTWYLDLLKQMSLVESTVSLPGNPLHTQCPIVYHAYSNYYSGEATNACAGCPWFCLLPFRSPEKGILVMENVKKRGYVMFDKMRILPLDHLLLIMTNLAHFHGRWLAYRWLVEAGRLSDEAWSLKQFKAALDTQKRAPKYIYNQLMNGTHKTVRRILQLENHEELIEKVDKFFKDSVRQQLDQLMGSVSSPIDTCCHGDFWSNNIMFKYEGEKVKDTILVDFQLINYGHPAYDVLYMLYISTDLEFRDAHMTDCLTTYWNTLSIYLEQFKPNGVSYDEAAFHADIKTYKTVAFTLATTVLPNVLSSSQVDIDGLLALRDMQRKQTSELEDPDNTNSKEIKRRVVGLSLSGSMSGRQSKIEKEREKAVQDKVQTILSNMLKSMQQMGNSKARTIYESNLPEDFRRPQTDSAVESFVRQKYEKKKFLLPNWEPTKPPEIPIGWDDDEDAALAKAKLEVAKKVVLPTAKSPTAQTPNRPPAKKTESPKPVAVPLPSSTPAASTDLLGLTSSPAAAAITQPSTNSSAASDLLGLQADFGDFTSANSFSTQPQSSTSADLFGSAPQTAAPAAPEPGKMSRDSIMALFGSQTTGSAAPMYSTQPPYQQPPGGGGQQGNMFPTPSNNNATGFLGMPQYPQHQQQQQQENIANNPFLADAGLLGNQLGGLNLGQNHSQASLWQ